MTSTLLATGARAPPAPAARHAWLRLPHLLPAAAAAPLARATRRRARSQPLRPDLASTTPTMATAAPTAWPGWRSCSPPKASAMPTARSGCRRYPRVLGYVFKPVSFWYCHRRDGSLAAIVVEVNNTFGERHCYLLAGPTLAFGRELRAAQGLPRLAVLRASRASTASASAQDRSAHRRTRRAHRPRRRARPAAGHQRRRQSRASSRRSAMRAPSSAMPLMTLARHRPHPLAGAAACRQARARTSPNRRHRAAHCSRSSGDAASNSFV